jgi:YgiT-type zinc finger domain-containing protein
MKTEDQSQVVCYACEGTLKEAETTFTVDFGAGVVVVRNVPAMVCSRCGLDWIDDDTAARIEKIVKEAKNKHSVVEVMSLSA